MKWVTRDLVHFDRVASPWLIRRFVDSAAQFIFVQWGEEDRLPADAMPFAIPGVELSAYDEEGTTFAKIMRKYALEEPALLAINNMITSTVNLILHDTPLARSDFPNAYAEGVLAVIAGIMMTSPTDGETIERSLVVFDGLYARLRAGHMLVARNEQIPPAGVGPDMWDTLFFSAITLFLRGRGSSFDSVADAEFDPAFEAQLLAIRPKPAK